MYSYPATQTLSEGQQGAVTRCPRRAEPQLPTEVTACKPTVRQLPPIPRLTVPTPQQDSLAPGTKQILALGSASGGTQTQRVSDVVDFISNQTENQRIIQQLKPGPEGGRDTV